MIATYPLYSKIIAQKLHPTSMSQVSSVETYYLRLTRGGRNSLSLRKCGVFKKFTSPKFLILQKLGFITQVRNNHDI